MAFEIPGFCWSAEVGADLSAGQYKFATMDTDGQLSLTGAGLASVGVIQSGDGDAAGKAVEVMSTGITKITAGTGGLSAGDVVAAGAAGTCVAAAGTDVALGIALIDAGDTNIGTILLTLNGGDLDA